MLSPNTGWNKALLTQRRGRAKAAPGAGVGPHSQRASPSRATPLVLSQNQGPHPLPARYSYTSGLARCLMIHILKPKEHTLNWNMKRYSHTRWQGQHNRWGLSLFVRKCSRAKAQSPVPKSGLKDSEVETAFSSLDNVRYVGQLQELDRKMSEKYLGWCWHLVSAHNRDTILLMVIIVERTHGQGR